MPCEVLKGRKDLRVTNLSTLLMFARFVSSDKGILFLVFKKQREVITPLLIVQVEIKEYSMLQRVYSLSRQRSVNGKAK